MSSEPLLSSRKEEWRPLANYCSFDFHSIEECPQSSLELKQELVVVGRGAWRQFRIVKWSQQKVIDPFVRILRRGLEPKLLSLSAALGLALGVFPICGVPLFFCALAAMVLRSNCHVPTLMLGNFVASFFELGLVVPYMRVGESVTGVEHFTLSSSGLWEAFRGHDPRLLVLGMLHAIVGWFILAPITIVVLYITFLPVFKYLTAKLEIAKCPLHQNQSDSHANVRPDGVESNHECVIDA